jgi:hypothetical protein
MRAELLRDRYEALEVVGRGGEAEVLRALDHLHGRQVARKFTSSVVKSWEFRYAG